MLMKLLPWGDTHQLQPRMGIWTRSIAALKAPTSQDIETHFSACQERSRVSFLGPHTELNYPFAFLVLLRWASLEPGEVEKGLTQEALVI